MEKEGERDGATKSVPKKTVVKDVAPQKVAKVKLGTCPFMSGGVNRQRQCIGLLCELYTDKGCSFKRSE